MRDKRGGSQTLNSVSQALRVLELLQEHPSLGTTEIARMLDLSSSSTHRILVTMLEADFVRQTATGRKYQLGPAMSGSRNATAIEDCIEVGAPFMATLRDESGETVHLAVLRRTDTHFVAAYESHLIMRVTSRVGRRIPAHATAAGKLLLSFLSDDELRALYAGHELSRQTADSIRTFDALIEAIREARRTGYARNMLESEAGIAALAVPLRYPDGRVTCSLTLTGPDSRFNPGGGPGLSDRERELLDMLQASAQAIEAELAAQSSTNPAQRRT